MFSDPSARRAADRHPRSGHSMAELLIVGGIISALLGVLIPTVASIRRKAKTTVCLNNVRQITLALKLYARDWDERFPPNISSPAPGKFWTDGDRIVPYLGCAVSASGKASGGVMACPEDDAVRAYSMNVWASSTPETYVNNPPLGQPISGVTWGPMTSGPKDRLILVAEAWSGSRIATPPLKPGDKPGVEYAAPASIGFAGSSPGQKFGAGTGWSGIAPPAVMGRWGLVNSELTYARHRTAKKDGSGQEPKGVLNIGYADGHAETATHEDLVDQATGKSTLRSQWSPMDPAINDRKE